MNCPKCGSKMIQLFTSEVCDRCNPKPSRFIDMKDVSESFKISQANGSIISVTRTPGNRRQKVGHFYVDECDFGVDGGAPSISFTHYDMHFDMGFIKYDNLVCAIGYNAAEGPEDGEYINTWQAKMGECWTPNKAYMALLGCLAQADQTLDDHDLRDLKSAIELMFRWQEWD